MLHTKNLWYKVICKLLSCNISFIIIHSFIVRLKEIKAKNQIPAAKGWGGEHFGIYNQPPACFSASIKSPVALQNNPSKVNNRVFFYQGGLKRRSLQNGVEPCADENAHKRPHLSGI
jgi:hypothetical protein